MTRGEVAPGLCAACLEEAPFGRAPAAHDPCARHPMFPLVGRVVTGLFVAPGHDALVVATDAGVLRFDAEGDCCSETWFADITGVDALRGARVWGVAWAEVEPVEDGRSRQDHDSFHGVALVTERGRARIVFRNSSNGYYDGHVNAGVALGHVPDGYVEVADDWSAP